MSVKPSQMEHHSTMMRHVRADAFVRRHFTWPGTLRLHRAALGFDILRAPINVVLSPILVLARLAAWVCRKLRLAQHAQLRIDTGLEIYFCNPQSPWQRGSVEAWKRGSNENTNGLLRQYFPKGTDLSQHGTEELSAVAHALNTRPRKTLGWRTPAEAFDTLIKTDMIVGVATTG